MNLFFKDEFTIMLLIYWKKGWGLMRIFNIKRKSKPPIIVFSQEFSYAIEYVNDVLTRERSTADKIVILDFMIDVIKKDLKTDLLSCIFYSQEHFTRHFRYPFPLFYCDEQGNEQDLPVEGAIQINLAQDDILVMPWHRERLCGQIKNIFSNNFVYDRSNHKAYYFSFIDLCYVYNGNHSVSSGIVFKKGTIEAKKVDLTKLFPHIHTDGKHWYNTHSGNKIGALADFRLGIIYEIAKIKYTVENDLTA